MNDADARKAQRTVSEWLRLCEENGRGSRAVDSDHSALLYYMLKGNKPFVEPPPVMYSYPCYSLAEGKRTRVLDLRNCDWDTKKRVSVGQNPQWVWEDEDKFLLKYLPTGDLYQFEEATAEQYIDACIAISSDFTREQHIAMASKRIEEQREKGSLQGFLQRVDGEAERKEAKWMD